MKKNKSRSIKKSTKLKIGVVTALFNDDVTLKLEKGALKALKNAGLTDKDIIAVRVPGAFEIPLAVQALFDKKRVDGVVAVGAVIRGDTTHYDYVCEAVERGCSQLSLEYKKPVGFGVLTTENDEQALARAGGVHGNKGFDAAQVVITMCMLLKGLQK
ncbi:MAG: 6,7-dimethyl-8-ribityllumazine synthase [Oligoflexia bacterium]|nr:6,7-dimethyl-8-ribityllumazine synthase [Oligoflexia bacterium]